jgi:multicomponent Na+:H+ antiporter subunit B
MTAAGAILAKDLISAVFILGTYSFTLALIWALLGAVDVAFVEAVVGAGLATVFFLLTISTVLEKDTQIRRSAIPWTALIGLPIVAILLLYGAADLPAFGDLGSPASTHISPIYLERSVEQTRTPNVVTAILMDYRSLDTLVETVVIFTAGIACALILRKGNS